jgi:catechol 2,3-dioxygenase-like lactoylglutathione lyase family enzyme
MFDHVTIRATDRVASEEFYDTVLGTLGRAKTRSNEGSAAWGDFSLLEDSAAVTRHVHIGFVAPTRDHVDEFWRLGTEVGYPSDGEPGPRPEYDDDYYGAFLIDPDGNSAEAVHDGSLRRDGNVDHVWLRVADVEASRSFYEIAGCPIHTDTPERVSFRGREGGTFSVVAGQRLTEHLHMAFPARDDLEVDAFHQALVTAGYRDNGPPGERPNYHPGYYAAFVLDPDGNNIERVHHNRPA